MDRILFDSGSAKIKLAGLKVMKTVSEVLKQVTDKQIRINGHTDNVPIGAGLKDRFPSSVVRCLIDEGGLAPELLTVAGHADRNQLPPTTQRKVAPKIGGLRLPCIRKT